MDPMLSRLLRHAALAGVTATASLFVPSAAPAAADTPTAASSNWAGYAVTGALYRRVAGSWTVTRPDCSSGAGFSAVWIGLGGFDASAQALEQTGTAAECSRSGRVRYTAWSELVPATSRTIPMKIRPGDRMAATVTVSGRRVTLTLTDRTTRKAYRKVAAMAAPDVSSAEWIVEAPMGCDTGGNCLQLPLNDFGRIRFSGASATSTTGHTGTISDPAWSPTAIELSPSGSGSGSIDVALAGGAVPSSLSAGGSAFSVRFRQGAIGFANARRTLPSLARPVADQP